jgi:NAD-dependent deacetylase
MPPDHRAEPLAAVLMKARRVVFFTGAGISTESGIPDFRSAGGVWTRYDPRDFTFSKYVASAEVRKRAWGMRREFWDTSPQPNAAHHALARMELAGRAVGVITQNIDGLHQQAGSRQVVELHGTSRYVECIGIAPRVGTPDGCGFRAGNDWAFGQVDAGIADPTCPDCGGLVKSATVSFGQNLYPGVLDRAAAMVAGADAMVAIGSSLQVYPAADLPARAARAGIPLAIVNDEPTPLDDLATVVVRGRAGTVLPPAVDAALRNEKDPSDASERPSAEKVARPLEGGSNPA